MKGKAKLKHGIDQVERTMDRAIKPEQAKARREETEDRSHSAKLERERIHELEEKKVHNCIIKRDLKEKQQSLQIKRLHGMVTCFPASMDFMKAERTRILAPRSQTGLEPIKCISTQLPKTRSRRHPVRAFKVGPKGNVSELER